MPERREAEHAALRRAFTRRFAVRFFVRFHMTLILACVVAAGILFNRLLLGLSFSMVLGRGRSLRERRPKGLKRRELGFGPPS